MQKIDKKDYSRSKQNTTNININKNVKRKIRKFSNDEKISKENNTFEDNNSNSKNKNNNKNNIFYKNKKRNKNEYSNNIERNNSFDIINNKPHLQNNIIQKSSNFNIENHPKNNLDFNNNKNNIEFKSEFKKSQIFLKENNNDDIILNDLTKSSLKDYINKEAKIIKQNPSYINKYKKEKTNEDWEQNEKKQKIKNKVMKNKINKNPFLDNINDMKINFNDNISNISPNNNNNDISINSIKSKLNKFRNSNESSQQTVIKIDLRQALSKIQSKNSKNESNDN